MRPTVLASALSLTGRRNAAVATDEPSESQTTPELEPASTGRVGGFTAGSLNHLVSPTPLAEWVTLRQSRRGLIARLRKEGDDMARLEIVLDTMDVTAAQREAALAAADRVRE